MSSPALLSFIKDWCSDHYKSTPVDLVSLEEAETRLRYQFPNSYKAAVLTHGLPRPTIELLDFICDNETGLRDLSDFFSPAEIVTQTIEWREIGMPHHLVAFASDCAGNKFSFSTSPNGRSDEVWFFDHDFNTVDLVADSFEGWLEQFAKLKGQ